jgi:hypothetical protein
VGFFKRLARTIDVEVGPEFFVFRYGQREHRVPTRGYIRRAKGAVPPYEFELERRKDEDVPIRLFEPLAPELEEDFIQILSAFLMHGVRPLYRVNPWTALIRPVIVFHRVERLDGALGPTQAVLKEAAKIFALGDKEVYFDRVQ